MAKSLVSCFFLTHGVVYEQIYILLQAIFTIFSIMLQGPLNGCVCVCVCF